jgi:branched-chain amino acid transport system ATP-binding protein
MTADEGTADVLVEQHAEIALALAADAVVLERGRIAHRSSSRELLHDATRLDRLLGLKISREGG